MENTKPFIHLVKTPYAYYVFDVNTNNIYMIEEDVYDALLKMQNNTIEGMEEIDANTKNKIKKMMKEGLLSSKRPKEIRHPLSNKLGYRLNNKLRKITLQITQECNFRCSYCIYSSEQSLQRNHANKVMSLDTIKKSIDFLISHSTDRDGINIGFYGGEPLLEFENIKKAIEYAEKSAEGKEVSFTVTTNGSLLDDNKIEYFIEHNVDVMISMDGPKEIHDKNRRFAENGCGTFKVVEKNLLRIKEKYPEFFKRISYSMVIDPRNDYSCINKLFMDYKMFENAKVRSAIIDDFFSNEKIYATEDYTIKRNYDIFKAFLHYFNRIEKKYTSPIALQEVTNILEIASKLGGEREISDITSHGGPCVPGEVRLFISAEGYFYPCERVSEISDIMRIGHIDHGFNIENARQLLDIGKLTESSCKNCWAIKHCIICCKLADNIKELSPDLIKSHCNLSKNQFDYKLRNYLFLNEVKKFFDSSIKIMKNGVEINESNR